MSDNETPKTVRVDAIFIAQQFERTAVTLEHLKDRMDRQSLKESAQDVAIAKLSEDVTEVKADVRAIKEARPPRLAPITIAVGVATLLSVVVLLLNQLYR